MHNLYISLTLRLRLMEEMGNTFNRVFLPILPARFHRGQIQKELLKLYKLPRTGPNMRLINEMIENNGFYKIKVDGICLFKKRSDYEKVHARSN